MIESAELFDNQKEVDTPRFVALIELESLPFYLQIGFISSPAVTEKMFNSERLDGYTFQESIPVYPLKSLTKELLEDKVGLVFHETIPKKVSGIHVSCIKEAYALAEEIDAIRFKIEANNIGFTLDIEPLEELPLSKDGLKAQYQISFVKTQKLVKELDLSNRLKGAAALWNGLQINNKTISSDKLIWEHLPISLTDIDILKKELFDSRLKSINTIFKEFEKRLISLEKVFRNYISFLKKYFGANSEPLVQFLQNPRKKDDVIGFFKLSDSIRNKNSNFLFLEFTFLYQKYSKLNNQVSGDLKRAVTELIIAYAQGYVPRKTFDSIICLLGYFSGYASLFDFAFNQDELKIDCNPRLNDLNGAGLAFDLQASNKIKDFITGPSASVKPEQQESTHPFKSSPANSLEYLEAHPEIHSRVSMLWYLLGKLSEQELFFDGLEKALEHRGDYDSKPPGYVEKIRGLMNSPSWEQSMDENFNEAVRIKLIKDGLL